MPSPGIIQNADGLTVQMSGEYQKFNSPYVNRLRSSPTTGPLKLYVMDVDLVTAGASATYFPVDLNNDGTRDGFTTGEAYLPSGSCIVRSFFVTTEVAAGGTDFTVGTYSVAGVAIDADGILDATDGAAANMGTVGEYILSSGALITNATGQVGLTAASYVAVTTNGTFTAGKGRLYIEVCN